jgi:hypothetical protein
MQKVINGLAIASFAVSAAVVGGGVYVYLNKDAMIESARQRAIEEVTKTVTEALPGMISGAMPSMPGSTGDILNTKPAIPGL